MKKILILLMAVLLLFVGCKAPVNAVTTTILMDGDKTITAHFTKIQYTLTTSVEPVDGGTISGAGTYDVGTSVEVEATPALGYEFDSWSFGTEKWSGLGMGLFFSWESGVDTMLANGFTNLRIDIPDYQDSDLIWSKAMVIRTIAKGAKVVWGVTSNPGDNPDYIITAESWSTFRQAILDNAQWAQDNGVFEFQIGNEEEYHIDETTMTVEQLISNLKSVATEVKQIFTNGNVSYTCADEHIDDWVVAGKGDLDILASNIYKGGNGYYSEPWKAKIDNLVNAFGVDGTYITEFNLSWSSLDDYSTDEAIQAADLTEMIGYIKASGITRAYYFCWKGYLGVVKDDGTYRLLWDSLLNSN